MGCVCVAKNPEVSIFSRNRINNLSKSYTLVSSKFVRELNKHPDTLYTKISILGSGTFGQVYLVRHNQTGITYAMKEIKKNSLIYIDTLNEIQILKSLDHINILKIYEYFYDESHIYIICEYCKGGELLNKIKAEKRFRESVVRTIMRQIFSAVYYCHSKNIIHRDLKPQNILIEDENEYSIKIIDFGTSEIFSKNKAQVCVGTLLYMAPEMITHSEYNKKYDMWSCGVILYLLLSGSLPFRGKSEEELCENIKNAPIKLDSPAFDSVSDDAKDLILKLLNRDMNLRISAEQALSHPFFKETTKSTIPYPCLKKMCNNLFAYNATEIFQRAVLGLIIQTIDKSNEVKQLRNFFKIIDKNLDGRVTVNDLVETFSQYISEDEATRCIKRLFKMIGREDYIEFEEFLQAAIDKNILLSDKNLYIGFILIDSNKDNKICHSDLKSMLVDIDNSEINRIVYENDEDGDSKLNFAEFSEMIKMVK